VAKTGSNQLIICRRCCGCSGIP